VGCGPRDCRFSVPGLESGGGKGKEPDWSEVISTYSNCRISNVRACLQHLERELLARGVNDFLADEMEINGVINVF
jgi:hypothetical protein